MSKVIQTKSLNKCFRDLLKHGKKGKDAITKVKVALAEAAADGKISSINRTNNGETRIDNAEKYDLGDGYRLVVQLIDDKENTRAFLFAGDHEESEQWLKSHKDYKWVKNKNDQTLEFIQVSEKELDHSKVVDPDLTSAEALRGLPLLRVVEPSTWQSLNIKNGLLEYISSITSEDWECDPSGILEHIENISSTENAMLIDDLISHAHKGELTQLTKRIHLALGSAQISTGSDLAKASTEPQNSEIFVTWEEVASLPENSSWADWLLFLHPEQKAIAVKDFRGSARLRGVSGSGKTCVMLHRAKFLAKKYRKPILLLTLTESMRKLLDSLIKELCGVESSYITTSTISNFAKTIIEELHPKGPAAYRVATSLTTKDVNAEVVEFVRNHKFFPHTKLSNLDNIDLIRFVEEEVFFIRTRLRFSEFPIYVDTQAFKRTGRIVRLSEEGRRVFLDAAIFKVSKLKELCLLDHEGIVSAAVSLLMNDTASLASFGWASFDSISLSENINRYMPYRSILVDEVQDLSQLEVAMLAAMPMDAEKNVIANAENGLFLVGDGAQTIYNKGFSLKNCGVSVNNRSYVLQKNYRNSKEIMAAAYSLIEKYKFADIDEENVTTPTKPDFAVRTGEKPFVIKCKSEADEITFTASFIANSIKDFQETNETDCYPPICVIGFNQNIRNRVSDTLLAMDIQVTELKQSSALESANSVVISTIESAKGHEFQKIFIVGATDGVIPNRFSGDNESNLAREASRLYVGMTRAQESLFITYNIEKDNMPSRFLIDIQHLCDEYEYHSKSRKLEKLDI